jgi:tRNA threonylcarbamoyladenosine modification (KEOPS) complex  Pcc1 subunit
MGWTTMCNLRSEPSGNPKAQKIRLAALDMSALGHIANGWLIWIQIGQVSASMLTVDVECTSKG